MDRGDVFSLASLLKFTQDVLSLIVRSGGSVDRCKIRQRPRIPARCFYRQFEFANRLLDARLKVVRDTQRAASNEKVRVQLEGF